MDGRIEDQSALQPYWGNKAAPCPRWSPPFHGDEAVAGSDLNQCPRVLREMLSSDVQGSPTARPAPSPPFVSGGGHGRSFDMGSVDIVAGVGLSPILTYSFAGVLGRSLRRKLRWRVPVG